MLISYGVVKPTNKESLTGAGFIERRARDALVIRETSCSPTCLRRRSGFFDAVVALDSNWDPWRPGWRGKRSGPDDRLAGAATPLSLTASLKKLCSIFTESDYP